MVADPRLVIVRRGQFATFELLTRTFVDDPSVQIVWDRRIGERRRAPADEVPPGEERRRAGRRRQPPMQWEQMHYIIAGNETFGAPA